MSANKYSITPELEADGFCKGCGSKPCRCKELNHARKFGKWNCISCGVKLLARGGYAGLDMCGPCVTGEADTVDEV